jgi:hypothetical protein
MEGEAISSTKILIVSVWGDPKYWQLRRYNVELDSEIKELFNLVNLSEKEIQPIYQATKDYQSTFRSFNGMLQKCKLFTIGFIYTGRSSKKEL